MIKEPPLSKIYEAYSAIADQRVKKDGQIYLVTSSDNAKTYTVKEVGNTYSSNDNATIWQHYSGYPIIAVLMLEGKLNYDCSLLPMFKGIPWKALNTKHKNKYDLAIAEAFQQYSPETNEKIQKCCLQILSQLLSLDITIKGNREPIK